MSKIKKQYVCSECGGSHPQWQGQCPHCEVWNTMSENIVEKIQSGGRSRNWAGEAGVSVTSLARVPAGAGVGRIISGSSEFDRVLGGGIAVGGVTLLGGDPGIGKSTLLLQTLAGIGKTHKVLYVSGEESLQQVAGRANRLGLDPEPIHAIAEVQLEKILATMANNSPRVVVIDSIQTVYSETLSSAPGSVAQVRECAAQLTQMAKRQDISILLVGHVTKDGSLAGPRVLEHMVDAVLHFEGDPQSPYRLIRALKNRFGAVNELGAFEMTEMGLKSVDNPSSMFLSLDRKASLGSCVFILQEGPRPMLIEIQSLVDDSPLGNPRRLAVGVDGNRLAMLLAILHKHAGLSCADQDVFVNAVGGARAIETACDLPMCLSLISSLRNKAVPEDVACFGEVGLNGEVRPVQRSEDRVREAAKQGFKRIMLPWRNLPAKMPPGVDVRGVRDLSETFSLIKEWETS